MYEEGIFSVINFQLAKKYINTSRGRKTCSTYHSIPVEMKLILLRIQIPRLDLITFSNI